MKITRLQNRRTAALTRTEVLGIVACVAVLGAFLLLPALAKAREKAQRASCQCRLKQLGLSFRTWEGDFTNQYPMSVSINDGCSKEWQAGRNLFRHFSLMSKELNNPVILVCPSDDRPPAKSFATMSNTNLSYFVGLDADETMPAMFLTGDRNLVTNGVPVVPGLLVITAKDTVTWSDKMHRDAGNVGLADGSVQQTSNASFPPLILNSGTNVIRLAIP